MYRKVNRLSSPPPTVQTEPEDLSSSVGQGRGASSGLSGATAASLVPSAASWALSKNKLLLFCDIVLQHANYPHCFRGEASCDEEGHVSSEESGEESKGLLKNERVSESPLNSVGESARESTRSSTSSTDSVLAELEPDDPTNKSDLDSVTCWCGKPWQGRPMIECDACLVWYHMSCESVRRNHVPDFFQCSRCQEKLAKKKRSSTGSCVKEESRRSSKGKKRKSLPSTLLPRNPYDPSSPCQGYVPAMYIGSDGKTINRELQNPLRVESSSTTVAEGPASLSATLSPSKPRHHRKHKSNGGSEGVPKKRKSAGKFKYSVDPVSNGLGDSHPAPPPTLLPCLDNSHTSSSISTISSPNPSFDYKTLIKPNPVPVVKSQRSPPPPIPEPLAQVASSPPPNLLLSSNFVMDPQPHHLAYHHHASTRHHTGVLVVGGGGSTDSVKHAQS